MNPLDLATQGLLSQRPITIATDGLLYIGGGGPTVITAELATLLLSYPALQTNLQFTAYTATSGFTALDALRVPGGVTRQSTLISALSEALQASLSLIIHGNLATSTGTSLSPSTLVTLTAGTGLLSSTAIDSTAIPGAVIRIPEVSQMTSAATDAVMALLVYPIRADHAFTSQQSSTLVKLVTTLAEAQFAGLTAIRVPGQVSRLVEYTQLISNTLDATLAMLVNPAAVSSIAGPFDPSLAIKIVSSLATSNFAALTPSRIPGPVDRTAEIASAIALAYNSIPKVTLHSLLAELSASAIDAKSNLALYPAAIEIPILVQLSTMYPHPLTREVLLGETYSIVVDPTSLVGLTSATATASFEGYDSERIPGGVYRVPLVSTLASGFDPVNRIPGPVFREGSLYSGILDPTYTTIVAIMLPSAAIMSGGMLDFRIRNLKATAEVYYYSRDDGTVYVYGADERIVNMLRKDRNFARLARANALPAEYAGIQLKQLNALEINSNNSYITITDKRSVAGIAKDRRTV